MDGDDIICLRVVADLSDRAKDLAIFSFDINAINIERPKMDLILKNTKTEKLKIYVEPSTDEIFLEKDDTLTMRLKVEGVAAFEIHHCDDSLVIWIPHGQSADFYVNGNELATMCSQYIW